MTSLLSAQASIALQGLVLAGGQSLRFKTGTPKLLEQLCGQAIVTYPVKALADLGVDTIVVSSPDLTPLKATIIREIAPLLEPTFVIQHTPQGTADAVACTQSLWHKEHILIINGDMPLVTPALIARLYEQHLLKNADASFVIAHNPDPSLDTYYFTGSHAEEVEFVHKTGDHGHADKNLCCIDAGIYIFKTTLLHSWITSVQDTADHYCTDIVHYAQQAGCVLNSITAPYDDIREVNTPQDFWVAQQIKRAEIIRHWMHQGVVFTMPQTVHIDINVTIKPGTRIGGGVHLFGKTSIGAECSIGEFSIIEDSVMHDRATILPHSVITESTIGMHAAVGPFAHLRPGTRIDDHVTIGNFVEITRSKVGIGSKIKHLSYVGDATIHKEVNIGAGTIICNYDGFKKHPTTIGEQAFIGSNSTIIAPASIGEKAFTAAGSVITDPVPANALAIARSRQVNKDGYAEKIREHAQNPQKKEASDNQLSMSIIPTPESMIETR